MDKTVLIFLGPPGIGKGTQAAKIGEHLHLPHISTGDILRDHVKRETPLGKQIQTLMESGQYVPDSIMDQMIQDRVQSKDCLKGFILDGYPRTIAQALTLEHFIKDSATIKVINFFAETETIVKRLSGRLICKHCGKSYHKTFSPPQKDNICDICSNELTQRKDDQEAVVLQRLDVYEKQTAPLIQFYKERSLLQTILCKASIEEIFNNTLKVIQD